MIRSMTGFGDASSHDGDLAFGVEVRSVNNKFLKTTIRVPERLAALEPELEQMIRASIGRGSVTLTVTCSETGEAAAHTVNAEALRKYAEQIAGALGMQPAELDVAGLVTLPGVLQPPGDEETRLQSSRASIRPLVELALEHLVQMRTREGVALADDLGGHLDFIGVRMERLTEIAPRVIVDYEHRLKSRMDALLSESDVTTEADVLVREIAVYAEKTDIAEELARLGEHLRHFRDLLSSTEDRPLGRTMDFLSQELLREANTIASKSPDAEMSRLIVEIKGAIDRIKEQVQNAE
ncbi:MAG: YicC/YloC family endoribonuclease [Planctomycetota bacterium]